MKFGRGASPAARHRRQDRSVPVSATMAPAVAPPEPALPPPSAVDEDGTDTAAGGATGPRPVGRGMRGRTMRAVGWTAGSRVLIQVLQFAVTAVLARLLTPQDFGLMVIATVFTGFAWVLADLGVGQAVIWVDDATERLKATAFWVNAIAGVVMSALVIGAAPLIALVFHNEAVEPIVRVVGLSFAVSLYVVHAATLQRAMHFSRIVTVEIVAMLGYAVISIALALAGLGPLSLAIASLAQSIIMTVAYWVVVRWRPRHGPDRASFRTIRRFSSGVFGSSALNYWARNIDNLLIGRFAGVATLGLYSRAYNLMQLPITQAAFVVGRVLFPAFSKVRNDIPRLRSAYVRVVVMVMALVVPLAVGLAAAAPAFIETVYGPRWTGVAPLLTVLALSAPAQVFNTLSGPMYQALGRTGTQFRRNLIGFVATAIAVAVGLHWGALGVCVGLLLRYYLLIPNIVSGIWPAIGMTTKLLVSRVWGIALAGVSAGIAIYVLRSLSSAWSAPAVLAVQVVAGAVAYGGVLWVVDRRTVSLVRHLGREPDSHRPGTPTAARRRARV